jgi:radical SAM superfamily enzyme YgiQ (UPF0313 family)
MNILVINISMRPQLKRRLFPVGLGFICTAIKNAGFAFDLLDLDVDRYSYEEVGKVISEKEYDVVCMGCIVTGYSKVKKLCSIVRRVHPKSKIVVGNSVATSIPDILLGKTEADVAVMSEGDRTIVDLLHCMDNGEDLNKVDGIAFKTGNKIIYTQTRRLIEDISSLPFIDFGIFDVEVYIANANIHESKISISNGKPRALPVTTARGCTANCTFCYHVFKGARYRHRTSKSIVNEIKELVDKYGINYVQMWDDLTFFSKVQAESLAQEIIDANLKINWCAQCRSNLFTKDEDMRIIEKLKSAGCCGFEYSLESSDTRILKDMNKKISIGQFSKQTSLLQKADVATWTSLVLGYPKEDINTIHATFDCCIENNIYPSVGYLLPQPGSVMYKYALDNGFIDDEEDYLLKMGDRQDLTINLTTMTDQEFEDAVLSGIRKCNEELKMGFDNNELIKTKFFRRSKV